MIRALYSAASGMTAQQLNVDNIAHNLANANTADGANIQLCQTFGSDAQVWLFGHALMEKLVAPRKAITAHVLVVQAETMETFGPLALNWIEMRPATMLMMVPGTKNGDRRRGPLAIISRMLSSIIGSPPMPEPTFTPTRSALDSSMVKPASSSAIRVAARP